MNHHGGIEAPSGDRSKVKELQVGLTYLAKNLWSYRAIVGLIEDRVLYLDAYGSGNCSRAHFVQKCPTIATEGEKVVLNVDENSRKLALQRPALRKDQKMKAMLIGKVVRDALEDFHVKHISDKDMPELNRTIRNAAATALHMLDNSLENPEVRKAHTWYLQSIPSYWEEPELTQEYVKFISGTSNSVS